MFQKYFFMSYSNDLYCITLFTTVLVRRLLLLLLLLPFFYIHVIYCVNIIMDTHIMGTRFDFFFSGKGPSWGPWGPTTYPGPKSPTSWGPWGPTPYPDPRSPRGPRDPICLFVPVIPLGPFDGPRWGSWCPGARPLG